MAGLNKVFLIGNFTADPELKQSQGGISVTSFTLGVSRRGEGTDFINVVAWRQTAELICKYFKKGSPICVCGSIQTRQYEKDGQKRTAFEVVANEITFIGGKKDEPHFEEISADGDLPF